MSWIMAFALTQLLEGPLYMFAMRKQLPLGSRLAASLGPSALTHPIVWFVIFPFLLPYGWIVAFLVAETFAVVVEALYLQRFGITRAWPIALAANAFSALTGLVLQFTVL